MLEKDLEADRGRGPCRICYEYEDAGEVIAPCLCKGSQRWIHRECLDRWRSSGFERAFTNCRECGYQYHMKLVREEGVGLTESQAKLLQTIGRQTLLTLLLLQLLIMAIAMLVRALDQKEIMVDLFGLPQEPEGQLKGDFFHALRYHKTTYYLCGLLTLLCIFGMIGSYVFCCSPRGSRREFSNPHIGGQPTCDIFDVWACHVCCDDCGRSCSSCTCSCPELGSCDFLSGGAEGGDCGECFIVVIIGAIIIFIFVGIFSAIVAVVTAVMSFFKRWAQLAQMRMLAKEYIVEDLAPQEKCIAIPNPQEEMSSEQRPPLRADTDEVQQQLAGDLNLIFGDVHHMQPGSRGQHTYGSTN